MLKQLENEQTYPKRARRRRTDTRKAVKVNTSFLAPPGSLPDAILNLPSIETAKSCPVANFSQPLSRRVTLTLAAASLTTLLLPSPGRCSQSRSTSDAKVTDHVYFDLSVAGRPLGRLVIGLFGDDSPESTQIFKKLCRGEYVGKGGRRAGYRGSTVSRVVKGERIDVGRIRQQFDEGAQFSGMPQRLDAGVAPPTNFEVNSLRHDRQGVVSVKKGGGDFGWSICAGPNGCSRVGGGMDDEMLVIGVVEKGLDIVEKLNEAPTNRKNSSNAFRTIGKIIGDSRAKVQLENKPLQKIAISDSGIL